MINISKLDFSGQHLYVGLDVRLVLKICPFSEQLPGKGP